MGMFDYVKCEVPLPDGWEPDELQSKDFDCEMTTIRITAEGRLLIERFERYSVPKAERPYPDAPDDSMLALAGCMGKKNRRWEDLDCHGDFNFYGTEGIGERTFVPASEGATWGHYRQEKRWHEYYARFTEGQLASIRAVAEERDSVSEPKAEDAAGG